jgi:hypothetical protein
MKHNNSDMEDEGRGDCNPDGTVNEAWLGVGNLFDVLQDSHVMKDSVNASPRYVDYCTELLIAANENTCLPQALRLQARVDAALRKHMLFDISDASQAWHRLRVAERVIGREFVRREGSSGGFPMQVPPPAALSPLLGSDHCLVLQTQTARDATAQCTNAGCPNNGVCPTMPYVTCDYVQQYIAIKDSVTPAWSIGWCSYCEHSAPHLIRHRNLIDVLPPLPFKGCLGLSHTLAKQMMHVHKLYAASACVGMEERELWANNYKLLYDGFQAYVRRDVADMLTSHAPKVLPTERKHF